MRAHTSHTVSVARSLPVAAGAMSTARFTWFDMARSDSGGVRSYNRARFLIGGSYG